MPAALPVVASFVELVAVWGWHAPVMRVVAETSLLGTVVEQATFLAAGVLLWSTSFAAPDERKHAADRRRRAALDVDPHDAARRAAVA